MSFLAVFVLTLCGVSFARAVRYQPGEVLVRFKPKVSRLRQRSLVADRGHRVLRQWQARRLVRAQIAPAQSVEDAVASYGSNPDVEFAQPNYLFYARATPNDTDYANQWALKNTGQTLSTANLLHPIVDEANPGDAGDDAALEAAWDISTSCSNVIVSVIDTGVNYNHEDLSANMWDGGLAFTHGWNSVAGTNDPLDDNGHGTHVAGIIGAVGNNSKGTAGVCWTAQIMAGKALDSLGSGTDADIIEAIDFSVAQGARVINLSLGGGGPGDLAFETAISDAAASGVIFVIAAGNDGEDNGVTDVFPCNYTSDNIICVAAVDQNGALASYSNFSSTFVHIAAPGTNIFSTWFTEETLVTDDFTSGWNYSNTAGTGWGAKNYNIGGTLFPSLTNPVAFNATTGPAPAANTDDRAYKTFDLSAYNAVFGSYAYYLDMSTDHNFVRVRSKASGGDPFAGGGTLLANYNGTTGGFLLGDTLDLTSCVGATCSLGFQLATDATVSGRGTLVSDFYLVGNTASTSQYVFDTGTSMATPMVAGVVALVMSYNPDYTYTDVIEAVLFGGRSVSALADQVFTGNTLSAVGALSYIQTPVGVAAVGAQ